MFVLEARANTARNGRKAECCRRLRGRAHRQFFHRISPFRHAILPMIEGRESNWCQRTVATAGHLDCGAGAALHELPGVALQIDS